MTMPTGEAWVISNERRSRERRLTTTLALPAKVLELVLRKTVKRLDGVDEITPVERALVPDEVFRLPKICEEAPGNRASNLLGRVMLDELPQIQMIRRGDLALWGPRAVAPELMEQFYDVMGATKLRDRWHHVRRIQRPGVLSSYAITSHLPKSADFIDPVRTDAQAAAEAEVRATMDITDFRTASWDTDTELLLDFMSAARRKLTSTFLGRVSSR